MITIRPDLYLQLLLINPFLENSVLNSFGFSMLTKLLKNLIARGCNFAVIMLKVLLHVFFPNQPKFPKVKGPWQEIKQPPVTPPAATPHCISMAHHSTQKLFLWSREPDEVGQMCLSPPMYRKRGISGGLQPRCGGHTTQRSWVVGA